MSFAVPARRPNRPRRFAASVLSALAIAGGLAGCGMSGPPVATSGDAARAQVELAELQRGRSLLVAKCGGCHRTPLPSEHRSEDWPHMLDEMAARSNLDGPQRQLIQEYLVTMAAR